jgi:hypothetical protein
MGGTLDGQAVVIVEGKNKGGLLYKVFFDAHTNLPIRREYEAETMPDRKKELRTAVIEYKEIDGLKYAFRTVESVEGKIVRRTEVDVKLGQKFDDEAFDKPVVARTPVAPSPPWIGYRFPPGSGSFEDSHANEPSPIFRVVRPPAMLPPHVGPGPRYWPPEVSPR